MLFKLTAQEITVVNHFNLPQPQAREEVLDYLHYTLFKQYQQELYSAVLGNPLIYNGLLQLLHMCEREETSIEEINRKCKILKFMFFDNYERVHLKYVDLLSEIHAESTLFDLGRLGFEHLHRAILSNRKDLIEFEIREFLQFFKKFANQKDRGRILAV